MDTCASVIDELKGKGSASIKKVLVNHGAKEPFFGVKISDLKPLEKRLKGNNALALELYATGISDAKYLAGLIADDAKLTRADLQAWVDGANWSLLSESTVPWVASANPHGRELALEWIESDVETTACAGWRTLACISLIKPDEELDLDEYTALLHRVKETIHAQPNRVRYSMNGFVISCGTNIAALTALATQLGREIGEVKVTMGETACKVPYAPDSIAAAAARGIIGKKRKTAKC